MPNYTKKDFARLCDLTTGNLSNYIARKNVIAEGEFIDTDKYPQNEHFLAKRLQKQATKPKENNAATAPQTVDMEVSGIDVAPIVDTPKGRKGKKKSVDAAIPPQVLPQMVLTPDPLKEERREKSNARFDVETEKKKAEIDRIRRQTQAEEMKMERQLGKYMPTELVKSLLGQHFRSMLMAMKNNVDTFIIEFGRKKKMPQDEIAYLRGQIIKMLNKIIVDADAESRKVVTNIVAEHSQQSAA